MHWDFAESVTSCRSVLRRSRRKPLRDPIKLLKRRHHCRRGLRVRAIDGHKARLACFDRGMARDVPSKQFDGRGIAVDPSTSTTRTGWTVGSEVEWAFARNWSATLEYDYYDFGSKGLTLTQANEVVTIASFKDTIHAVTTGVNFHF